MIERPILFSAPMVRALLAGTKTQTRRAAKGIPTDAKVLGMLHRPRRTGERPRLKAWFRAPDAQSSDEAACPYGKPGDTLWVREASWIYGQWHSDGVTATGRPRWRFKAIGQQVRFDNPGHEQIAYLGRGPGWSRRNSIHMPRWASRISLRITDVRMERLNDCSEADAAAEGVYRSKPDDEDWAWFRDHIEERTGAPPTDADMEQFGEGVWMAPGVPQGWGMTPAERRRDQWGPTARFAYRLLWEHINGPGSWDVNPWVWAVSFERTKP